MISKRDLSGQRSLRYQTSLLQYIIYQGVPMIASSIAVPTAVVALRRLTAPTDQIVQYLWCMSDRI